MSSHIDKQRELAVAAISRMDELQSFLDSANDKWVKEDLVYRFWHQSFKVYAIQDYTERGASLIRSLSPNGRNLSTFFEDIVSEGTGKVFSLEHNENWAFHTRPMLEAFWHVVTIVEMIVKYAPQEASPSAEVSSTSTNPLNMRFLDSGWALVLEVFNLR